MTSPSLLRVEELQRSFQQGEKRIEVLKGIHFVLERAQSAAIVGPSGCGKTTLLSLLAGLDQPSSGSVVLEGVPFNDLDESALAQLRAQKIGFIFQQFHLMRHLTALENISLPLELAAVPEATAKAALALKQVELSDRAEHLPSQLSGGECQRVAIARAIVTQPTLLLADEPTGNLDQKTGEQIADLLFNLVKQNGSTLILVTHHEALARRCGKIWRLDQGHLKAGS